MSLYLIGYMPKWEGQPSHTMFAAIDEWEVHDCQLPVRAHGLITKSSHDPLGVTKLARPYTASYVFVPGAMYWIVENDPEVCMPPNGTIIWRWPEVEIA